MTLRRLASALSLLLLGTVPSASIAQTTPNSVHLSWTASGDDSLTGTASQYDLRYSTSLITAANFASATQVGLPWSMLTQPRWLPFSQLPAPSSAR